MPRICTGQRRNTLSWKAFIHQQIQRSKALPFISHTMVCRYLFGDYTGLRRDYATYLGYPDARLPGLPKLTQYSTVMEQINDSGAVIKNDYLNWMKSRLCEQAEADGLPQPLLEEAEAAFERLDFRGLCNTLGYPRFGPPQQDPFLILAQLPLPLYITTSYHGVMEAALVRMGKQPRRHICHWSPDQGDPPDPRDGDLQPDVDRPLVYYLLGYDAQPHSLVLTQDDYLAWLVNVSREMGRKTDLIPAYVRHALAESSLLLLGYDLDEWEFRNLYWGLLAQRSRKSTSVSILKLRPDEPDKAYKTGYLRACAFEVYLGDLPEFAAELIQPPEGS